jgi:AP2 domain-containing protein
MQNRPSHGGTSEYRGVHWDKRIQRWRAAVKINGRRIRIGRFTCEEDAAEAARAARLRLMPYAVD